MVGIFKLQKEVKSTQKQPNCIERVQPLKSLSEKSCEIKCGGHEMAVMMLMIINYVYYRFWQLNSSLWQLNNSSF